MRAAAAALAGVLLGLPLAPPQAPAPAVAALSHVAVYVTSLEAARAFYGDLLGYAVAIAPSAGAPRTAVVRIAERQWVTLIEGDGEGEGQLHHVAFAADLAGARAATAGRRTWRPDDGDAFGVLDPDGHRLGFVDGAADAGPAGAVKAGVSPRMLHAGILVGDLDAALVFYRGTLGFEEFWRGAALRSPSLSWVNLRVPAGTDYLELMLYTDLPAPANRGSAHHICLEVADMDAALAVIRPRAARLGYARPLEIRTGINRKRQLNLFDPDGTRVELMEPATVDDGRPAPSSTLPPPRPRGRRGGGD